MPKSKTQLLYIHGGTTFKSKKDYLEFLQHRTISIEEKIRWSGQFLTDHLSKLVNIIRPNMPLKENAHYEDWKIHFERHFPLLENNIILVGFSLGGIFLARYLSENKFPRKILATYLIAPPFDNSLPGEDLVNGFKLKADLSMISKNSPNLNLLFSTNDPVVPPSQAEKFRKKLPKANIVSFEHIPGHFQMGEFPELVKMIKADFK